MYIYVYIYIYICICIYIYIYIHVYIQHTVNETRSLRTAQKTGGASGENLVTQVQGYLAHKKQPPPPMAFIGL